ncbi:MAG: hypothetical protein MUP64_10940 [Anaerolineae bacterium]|jgi:hypothetical protein|nr:hypothetical protein [Anaerolineae bacterium]
MERRGWNPAIMVGIVLGASLGAIAAVALLRRWRRGSGLSARDIPWREVITLIGPFVALTRRLVEMSRRELVERDVL